LEANIPVRHLTSPGFSTRDLLFSGDPFIPSQQGLHCFVDDRIQPSEVKNAMMKGNVRLFAISVFSASLVLTPAGVMADDNFSKPPTAAAAQTSKPKQANACRTRYRSCLKLNQIPPFECQYIYEDCIHKIY
jgi:hypothetical protein